MQGSGKSFPCASSPRVLRHQAIQKPTLVMLTDRSNLDDRLFGQFQRYTDILGQPPVQASGREHLGEEKARGGRGQTLGRDNFLRLPC